MDISIILKIAGIGILTAIVNIILKKCDKDEIATMVTIVGLIMVLMLVIDMFSGLFDSIKALFDL